MKPEFMRLRRALASIFVAVLLAAGIVALSPALSASAHHNTISISASCVNYVWTINWKVVNSEGDKWEKITASDQPSIIAVGTDIAPGASYTKSETVTGKTTKKLTISAKWSNGVTSSDSRTIYPGDFAGTCERPPGDPSTNITGQTCVTESVSPGSLSFSLTGLTAGTVYTVDLYQGTTKRDTKSSTGGTSFDSSFGGLGLGAYTLKAYGPGTSVVSSSAVEIIRCAPTVPEIDVSVQPCTAGGGLGAVRVSLSKLTVGASYLIELRSTAGVTLDTLNHTANAALFSTAFANRGPGTYHVTVSSPSGALLSTSSDAITAPLCDLDTLPPPTIEAAVDQCDGVDPAEGALSVTLGDLDTTKTYYVRIVDGAGDPVTGGGDLMVTGGVATTVHFPGITSPGSYTAQLLIDPGKQLAATDPNTVTLEVCLPTLAITGPGVLFPLGGCAAFLLTLGGAVVMGRLRRRMAL